MRRHHRTYTFKFAKKVHSKKGIAGFILAILSILAGAAMVGVSFSSHGNGTVYLGCGGMLSMLVSLLALILGGQGVREESSYKSFPVAALLTSLISLTAWIAIYVLGAIL